MKKEKDFSGTPRSRAKNAAHPAVLHNELISIVSPCNRANYVSNFRRGDQSAMHQISVITRGWSMHIQAGSCDDEVPLSICIAAFRNEYRSSLLF